jgi:hypothetical protein
VEECKEDAAQAALIYRWKLPESVTLTDWLSIFSNWVTTVVTHNQMTEREVCVAFFETLPGSYREHVNIANGNKATILESWVNFREYFSKIPETQRKASQVESTKCYNCGGFVHRSKQCKKPKERCNKRSK